MKCLVLDAMGVIFQAADDVAELLLPFVKKQSADIDQARLQQAYLSASLGAIGADEFWAQLQLAADLEDRYLGLHSLNPGVMQLLQQARDCDIPVWCLSNDLGRWSRKLRRRMGVEPLLSGAVISSDIGLRKPDPEIYQRFLTASNFGAADLLFVDDRENNIRAAQQLKIESHLFSPDTGFAPVMDRLQRQTKN